MTPASHLPGTSRARNPLDLRRGERPPDAGQAYYATQVPPLSAPTSRSHPQPHPSASSSQYRADAPAWGLPPLGSSQLPHPTLPAPSPISSMLSRETRRGSFDDALRAPNAGILYHHSSAPSPPLPPPLAPSHSRGAAGAGLAQPYAPSSSVAVPRLPPIMQVEKQQVTTSATQAASASRRRNEANFVCPVPGCGSTFTRRFNLRGHLRSHTAERPFQCEWPGCNKGFARQHDCKRHQALHTAKPQSNVCRGCGKTFSRLDALNRHRAFTFISRRDSSSSLLVSLIRSEGGAECRQVAEAAAIAARLSPGEDDWDNRSNSTERSDRQTP
ncbi:Transcriptional regulator CRZ1 [Grifola frondosa]|uniref:Transcriptional regulator CRZ1 n=1 Tax=Grifola frondosa TaxID=5627 RepID=A0A1C7LZF6_GRIFR|nr:Transcriptional regulator CRZ1 [Grifola frondosa]